MSTSKKCEYSLHLWWGTPLPEHTKVAVFMDGLKVGPSRTQLFRVHASTMEEVIQFALQDEYSHRQALSIASARVSLPVNKGSVSCMSTSKKCEYSLHLWWGTPLPEHTKVAVFMDGLKVGPSRTQLFRVHASTMEEVIQFALQDDDKYADALRESEGRGQISVRLAGGTVVNVPGVRMDLAVKFDDFYSTESFLVLDMDKYDLILGMPWLEKHEPWID
ncbi:Gag protein [Phytophthora palmivora]|uniref:Gag protein n=1 Tax=Phytophthora palmivora TaxID=4796 RepID=A0A2P4XTY0_9STRA|nr:Gag protein [Phytophthora palmivora]